MKAVVKKIELLAFGLLFISLICAILGAFIALIGGILGFENLRTLGGMLAGGGAIFFFAILFSPLGELVSALVGAPKRERKDEDARRNLGDGNI